MIRMSTGNKKIDLTPGKSVITVKILKIGTPKNNYRISPAIRRGFPLSRMTTNN